MHLLARRAKTVADDALLRAGSASGGGGMEPPGPAASFLINVNKGGNDVTGDGTDVKPYLTIGKGLAVAKTLPLTLAQQCVLLIGPGTYNESPVWPPYVWGTGFSSGYAQMSINGDITIDMAAWAAASALDLVQASVSFGQITGNLVLDFTGVAGPVFFATPLLVIFGNAVVTGDPVNGGEWSPSGNSYVGGTTTITGAFLNSFSTQFVDDLSIVSTAAQPGTWLSYGDQVSSPGLVVTPINVTLDSTAGNTVTANLSGTAVTGPLNLTGAGTSYSATSGGVPPVINLSAGAPPPVLLTDAQGIGYTPAVPGNWVSPPPTTEQEAFDRIAANTANAHPIP